MRASPVDEEHASLSGPPAGVAVIWLIFYGLIFAGWLGSGEARHVPNAYARADAAATHAAKALSARTSRPD